MLITDIKRNEVEPGRPPGVMAEELDCDIKRSEFELQSCYNVHFRTNTLEKL